MVAAIEVEAKTCTKCGLEKPLSAFSKDCRAKDGKCSKCKVCDAEYVRSPAGKESSRKSNKRNRSTIRGHLQRIFASMKQRCTDFKRYNYPRYGGRGIKICFKSSDEFVDYVINVLQIDPRGLQIDRIDNDSNYEPGNIRFVTCKENCNNKSNNKGQCCHV